MRWPGILLRIVGWLLTPLVAWAASLWGAWTALRVTIAFHNERTAIYAAFGVAVATGTISLYLWMKLLSRSPRLRKSLRVTREGLPVIEDHTPAVAAHGPTEVAGHGSGVEGSQEETE